ncbi:MAG: hypothetical protein MUF23_01980 [Pirellula sp.]|nr:hypothetical protein [Pirellula sp.]
MPKILEHREVWQLPLPSLNGLAVQRTDQSDAFFLEPFESEFEVLDLSEADDFAESDLEVLELSDELDLDSLLEPSLEDLLSAAADFLYDSLR